MIDYASREDALEELKSLDFWKFIDLGSDSGTLHALFEEFAPERLDWLDYYAGHFLDGEEAYNWLRNKIRNKK